MLRAKAVVGLVVMAGVILLAGLRAASADDAATAKELKQVKRELRRLETERARDRAVIQQLEQKVDQMEGQTAQLKASDAQVKTDQTKAAQELGQIKTQIASAPSKQQFSEAFGSYLGSHTFLVTGAAGVDYIYDQQSGAIDGLHHQ